MASRAGDQDHPSVTRYKISFAPSRSLVHFVRSSIMKEEEAAAAIFAIPLTRFSRSDPALTSAAADTLCCRPGYERLNIVSGGGGTGSGFKPTRLRSECVSSKSVRPFLCMHSLVGVGPDYEKGRGGRAIRVAGILPICMPHIALHPFPLRISEKRKCQIL